MDDDGDEEEVDDLVRDPVRQPLDERDAGEEPLDNAGIGGLNFGETQIGVRW